MINRNLSTLAANLEAAIIAAKEAGILKVTDRNWLDRVMEDQFRLNIRIISAGCTVLVSNPVHTLVRDTVEIVRKEFTSAMDRSWAGKINKLCYDLHNELSYGRLWKQVDLVSLDNSCYCPEYNTMKPCHMVVLIPENKNEERKFLVLDQYEVWKPVAA